MYVLVGGVAVLAAAAAVALAAWPEPEPREAVALVSGTEVTVYKSPFCGCCGQWIEHLEQSGFDVEAVNTEELAVVKTRQGVPEELASCHTAVVDGYVVEGHVPAADIARLLDERPAVRGLSVPGMPVGSPGMEDPSGRSESYEVLTFDDEGDTRVFSRY